MTYAYAEEQESYYNELMGFVQNSNRNPKDLKEARIHLTALVKGVTADEVRNHVRNYGYRVMPDKTLRFEKNPPLSWIQGGSSERKESYQSEKSRTDRTNPLEN